MHNSRDLLYNIVPIVNNVLCTLKFKKVNRTLSVLNTHTEAQGNSGGIGYVYYFNCGDGIIGVWIYLNSSNCTH